MKKYINLIIVFFVLFSCKPDLAQQIYESGDKSRYKEALEYILQDEKRAESSEGRKLIELLKVDYLEYKKELIKEQYKDTRIAYLKDDYLMISGLWGNNKRKLGLFRDCKNFVWSPDGRYLAYDNSFYNDVFMVEIVTGKITRLTNEDEICQNPSWTVDGAAVIFSFYNKIIEVDINTLEKREIKEVGDNYVYYPQLMDEARIVLLTKSSLRVLKLATGLVKPIEFSDRNDNLFMIDASMHNLTFSQDKNRLLLSNEMIDLNEKIRVQFAEDIYNASWSPGGDYMLYSMYNGNNINIYLKDMSESFPLNGLDLLIEENAESPAWSPILSEEILATFN